MPVRPLALAAVSAPQAPSEQPPDAWEYGLHVPHHPRSVAVARATVRTVLHEHRLPELTDSAELLTSELVTNAVRYSEGDVFVRMRWGGSEAAAGRALRVSVWDTSSEPPLARETGPEDAGGRGLLLVRRLAARWGTYDFVRRGGGKTVWFELGAL